MPTSAAAVLALALAGPALAMDPGPSDGLLETPEFTVRLPAGARRSEEPSSAGPQLVSWMADTGGGTVGLLFADFPADLTEGDTGRLLDRSRDAMLARVEGKLLRERDVSCDPDGLRRWPGRDLEARTGGGAGVAVRICLVGSRLYQLMAVHPDGAEVPPAYGPMVASFRPRPAARKD